jgi:hypothetical protein
MVDSKVSYVAIVNAINGLRVTHRTSSLNQTHYMSSHLIGFSSIKINNHWFVSILPLQNRTAARSHECGDLAA